MSYREKLLYASSTLLLCASLVTPCFAGKVKAMVGVNINFNNYKTYTWLPTRTLGKTGVVEDEPTITPVVRASVDRELTARGMKNVPSGGDLQVAVFVLTTSVPQLEAVVFGGPVNVYSTPIATMGRYNREGTLVINLIEASSKKSAWTAMVTESLSSKTGSGVKKIDPAVGKIFGKFPLKK